MVYPREKNSCFLSLFTQETVWKKTAEKKEEGLIWGLRAWSNWRSDRETVIGHFNRCIGTKIERISTKWSIGASHFCHRITLTGSKTDMITLIKEKMSIYPCRMPRTMRVIDFTTLCWMKTLTSLRICHWDAITSSFCLCSLKTTRPSQKWFSRRRTEIIKAPKFWRR